jgi:hypothetical protein
MPAGDKQKLMIAIGGLAIALAVLGIGLSMGDAETKAPDHGGDVPAVSDPALADPPGSEPDDERSDGPVDDPAQEPVGLPSASAMTRPDGGLDPAPGAEEALLPDHPQPQAGELDPVSSELTDLANTPLDWAALFQQLNEKENGGDEQDPAVAFDLSALIDDSPEDEEDQTSAPAPAPVVDPTRALSGMALRGVIAGQDGGIALLDGYMLRRGDVIPGTEFVVRTIRRDRILLEHPSLPSPVNMPLAPLRHQATAAVQSMPEPEPEPEPEPVSDADG